MNIDLKKTYYNALLERDPKYDGVFFVGVKTTGVFCHATCPARKPKFDNCEFFSTAKDALLASFRPCKRCQPLSPPNQQSPIIDKLICAVEAQPEKRWKSQDFRLLGLDESTARRQFKKRFDMTFIEYARSRRMGLAMKHIRSGSSVIDAQLDVGYESSSGFRGAFSKVLGVAPTNSKGKALLASWIDTPLGPMLAITDEDYLYLLEFVDRRGLEKEVERLRSRLKVVIIPGETSIIKQIKNELDAYFKGDSLSFKTPCYLLGSEFQRSVWQALKTIPPGQTCSYLDIARHLNHDKAYRAVANANGANQLALIIPCHRVINENGELGGYGGGISRKAWLLAHEKQNFVVKKEERH
jgi:AraC family transcriptional regulator of adaptative response/methylated-DNA-[protein]-cysteine methyltransferase